MPSRLIGAHLSFLQNFSNDCEMLFNGCHQINLQTVDHPNFRGRQNYRRRISVYCRARIWQIARYSATIISC